MEQNNLNLILEDSTVLEDLLVNFNSIYKKEISIKTNKEFSLLLNTDNVSPNDIFTLGGFYGTALFKKQKNL